MLPNLHFFPPGTLEGICSHVSLPVEKKSFFFPGTCISGELLGHFLSWAPKSTKPETHLPACSNAPRTVVSAHQTFQAQGNVETSEDSEGKDLQGRRRDVPAQQCAGSQPAEGSEIQEEDVLSPPLVPSKENFLSFPSHSPQGRFG